MNGAEICILVASARSYTYELAGHPASPDTTIVILDVSAERYLNALAGNLKGIRLHGAIF